MIKAKGITLSITDADRKKFDKIAEKTLYKKSTLLKKWIREEYKKL